MLRLLLLSGHKVSSMSSKTHLPSTCPECNGIISCYRICAGIGKRGAGWPSIVSTSWCAYAEKTMHVWQEKPQMLLLLTRLLMLALAILLFTSCWWFHLYTPTSLPLSCLKLAHVFSLFLSLGTDAPTHHRDHEVSMWLQFLSSSLY